MTITDSTTTPTDTPLTDGLSKTWHWAQNARGIAVVIGLVGIIGGVLIAMQTRVSDSFGGVETHPFIGLGVGVALGALVWATLFAFLGTWAQTWVLVQAVQLGGDAPVFPERSYGLSDADRQAFIEGGQS